MEAQQQIPDVPDRSWICAKVKNLKQVLEMKTVKSALLLRELFGEIELTPNEATNGEVQYTAKTKLKTFALYKDADKGSISLRKWRWGEPPPRGCRYFRSPEKPVIVKFLLVHI